MTSFPIAALLLAVAVPAPAEPAAPPPDTVTVTYDMAERMVEWLEAARAGASDDALRAQFLERVAPTAGCQAIVAHWARFREWNAEIFYRFVLEALGRAPTDAPLVDERGEPTRLGHARPLWQAALADPARVRRNLEALRAADVRNAALAAARRFLPPESNVSNSFHIVLFGASSAFSVGGDNGFDLLQLATHPDGSIDVERTLATFAHEMHHSGYADASRRALGRLSDDERLTLPGMLVGEGAATHFLTPHADRLEELEASPRAMDRLVAADWRRNSARLPEFYESAEQAIGRALEGQLPVEEIVREWLGGAIGPAYVLGVDMVATVDRELGREAVLSLFDPRRLLVVYNRAARHARAAGRAAYLFDDGLATRLAALE